MVMTQLLVSATSFTCVTTGVPQLSVVVPPRKSGGGTLAKHCAVTLGGQLAIGAVVSRTVIVWVQLRVLLAQSAAVQVRVMRLTLGQVSVTSLSLKLSTGTG
jgi:hypothetical protein